MGAHGSVTSQYAAATAATEPNRYDYKEAGNIAKQRQQQ
jgi:hypothetical protein